MKNLQKGFIVPLLLVIIVFLLIGSGTYVYTQQKQDSQPVIGNQTTQPAQPARPAVPAPSTQPSVTVLSPNGGEVWRTGETHDVRWTNNGFSNGVVYFELIDSRYNAATEDNQTHFRIANAVPNTGSYAWTIPSNIGTQAVYGSQYKIRISAYKTTSTGLLDYDNLVQGDVSDAPFTIYTPNPGAGGIN